MESYAHHFRKYLKTLLFLFHPNFFKKHKQIQLTTYNPICQPITQLYVYAHYTKLHIVLYQFDHNITLCHMKSPCLHKTSS